MAGLRTLHLKKVHCGHNEMAVKKKQEILIDITGMAFGGRGIAKVDGYAVFVDRAVPGDRVVARVLKKKKAYAEARVLEMVAPSPDRVEAPCRYSGFCGGCKWQFLDYEKQLAYKRSHVLEAVERIGGIAGVWVHETIPSENVFGYRNKMEFSCSDRRWLLPEELGNPFVEKSFALGLHVPGTFDKIIDIDGCLLHPSQGNRILTDVKAYMKNSGFPAYGIKSHEGFWRFLMLRHSVAHDQWLVNLVTSEDIPEAVMPLADKLMAGSGDIAGVVNNVSGKKAAISVGDFEKHLAGQRVLKEHLGPFVFEISANSFFQTNTRGAERLYDTVADYAGLTGGEFVVDLYSGTGTIAIWLSARAGKVLGLEIVESAVVDAGNNCIRNNVVNCRFTAGDIRKSISSIDHRPDVVVIDPPRAGMHKEVAEAVTLLGADRIVYVSCNPATLARDLAILSTRYGIDEIQPVDMFPHTYHIESVAKLTKKN